MLPLKNIEKHKEGKQKASLAAAKVVSMDPEVPAVLSEMDLYIKRSTKSGGEDVFASLLTSYGKSLVKQNTTLQLCHRAVTASNVALHTISKPSAVATCFNWQ